MKSRSYFSHPITPNWEGLMDCISRQETPDRVHFIELFLDEEVKTALCSQYGID